MKVIRKLNEASKQQIDIARVQYESAETEEEKINILIDFLKEDCGLKSVPANAISRFDFDFLNKWINAFKWEEAGAPGNEFIELLNYHTGSKNNQSSDIIVGDQDYFMKAYNCYAGTNYFSDPNSLKYNPIFAKSIYLNSSQDVKSIINAWSQVFNKETRINGNIEKKFKINDRIELFYEVENNIDEFIKSDIVNWPVRSYSDIVRRLDIWQSKNKNEDDEKFDFDNDEEEIKRLLNKNNKNREIAKRELEKNN